MERKEAKEEMKLEGLNEQEKEFVKSLIEIMNDHPQIEKDTVIEVVDELKKSLEETKIQREFFDKIQEYSEEIPITKMIEIMETLKMCMKTKGNKNDI